ncbi:hypothetical protein [Amphibacillus xylanus]|uniref:Uncharacterized protein n=1 Tax=Amphibacillus xylanus (strain ATCC 51415 / DSM 6626 / JCM 7361 / LMG 17667 / NBRC 15112 / Ep01) TaxID=698758 RepID=K0J7V3_AMPXN|nr:hypothetical protein [Amphibacillus xylanus]BAM48018.1 hypothetical protein AXY_18860 [Amphibacillus xylanus NBRC 15112]
MGEKKNFEIANNEYNEKFYQMKTDETLKNIEDYSIYLVSYVELLSKTMEDKNYLTENTLLNYRGIALTFSSPIEKLINSNHKLENKFTQDEIAAKRGVLIQYWTNLGSLLESSLQMFLAVYHEDYLNSFWGSWNNNSIKQVEEAIKLFNDDLKKIVKNNQNLKIEGLTGKNRKSLIKSIKDFIKKKKEIPSINKIMLSELIDFYVANKVIFKHFNQAELEVIRNYRNNVHLFGDKMIGSYDEINKFSKEVLSLLISMINQLPPLPEEIIIKESFCMEQDRLMKQIQDWKDK